MCDLGRHRFYSGSNSRIRRVIWRDPDFFRRRRYSVHRVGEFFQAHRSLLTWARRHRDSRCLAMVFTIGFARRSHRKKYPSAEVRTNFPGRLAFPGVDANRANAGWDESEISPI